MASPSQQALLDGPACPPPPGVVPNFVDPPGLWNWFLATLVLTVTVSTLAMAMRLYTKLFLVRKFSSEDYLALIGYAIWVGYLIPSSMTMWHGSGIHQWNVQLKSFISFLYYVYISSVMYGFSLLFIKASILLQYLHIFRPTSKRHYMYWGTWAILTLNTLFYLSQVIFSFTMCSPLEKYWNPLITEGTCVNRYIGDLVSGVFNVVSDFAMLLLPQRVIWNLQMPLKRKLQISLVFLTGLFVCITSIMRMYYSFVLAGTEDTTFEIANMGLWVYAELSVGITCSCLPVMPKFYGSVKEKVLSLSQSITSSRRLLSRRSFAGRPSSTLPDEAHGSWLESFDLRQQKAKKYNVIEKNTTFQVTSEPRRP